MAMMAQQMKTLKIHYPMIEFLTNNFICLLLVFGLTIHNSFSFLFSLSLLQNSDYLTIISAKNPSKERVDARQLRKRVGEKQQQQQNENKNSRRINFPKFVGSEHLAYKQRPAVTFASGKFLEMEVRGKDIKKRFKK